MKQLSMPLNTFLLVMAMSAALAFANNDSSNVKLEKKSAAEYWAEFKQDSRQTWKNSKEAFKDGWIESKLETALMLNKHLDTLDINIGVENNVATLDGDVHSNIEKELAENIALGIEGIDSVINNLKVIPKPAAAAHQASPTGTQRSFLQYVNDVYTTAAIKTELLASRNVEGLAIDVDTYNGIVTLSGKVDTSAQRDLAQTIAAKQDDVKNIVNKIDIGS